MGKNEIQDIPKNVDIERSVLASCLLIEDSVDLVVESLDKSVFYKTSHQKYFEAICHLHQNSASIDITGISSYLRDKHLTDIAPLGELAEIIDFPVSVNLDYHIRVLREKLALRRTIEICNAVMKRCMDSRNSSDETLEYAKSEIEKIEIDPDIEKSITPVSDLAMQASERYDRLDNGEINGGLSTGFIDLDKKIRLNNGEIIVLAGRPSMGKTAFAINLMLNIYEPVAFFSLEQSKDRLVDRMVANKARINLTNILRGDIKESEWGIVSDVLGSLSERRFYIDDTPALSVTQIAARSKRIKRKYGLSLVIIDYLQLVKPDYRKDGNRNLEVGSDMKKIKTMAKQLDIPVLIVSQLNRNLEKRPNPGKIPMLSDLRDSGEIEQDADLVLFAYRPEVYNDTTTQQFDKQANIYIAKNRDGDLGVARLLFEGQFLKFTDVDLFRVPEE